ncbi:MAG: hypothetical protein WAV73_06065 [Candidatus Moraniibacteriota bacterium]
MDNKKIPTLSGTIVIVIIAITAGMFVWQYEKNMSTDLTQTAVSVPVTKSPAQLIAAQIAASTPIKKTLTQPVETQSEEYPAIPSIVQPDVSGKYAGWKTYVDAQIGLEFKYPAEFVICKESADHAAGAYTIGMLTEEDYNKKVEHGGYQGGPSRMYVSYSNNYNPQSKLLEGTPISFAGGAAVGNSQKDGGAGYGGTYQITAQKNDYIFHITFWDGGKLSAQEKLIISSFKFTK